MARSTPNKPFVAGAAIEGVNATLRAYNKLGKEARNATKDKVQEIAQFAANETSKEGRRLGGRYAILAGNVVANRDRIPIVTYGGRKRAGVSGGASYNQLVYGMEFGANQDGPNGWKFPPRTPRKGRGNVGYWIFPTASRIQGEIATRWLNALEKIAEEWGRG
jgi:hypothetical protein